MKLKGDIFKQLRDALLDAFPDHGLRSMVRMELEEDLQQIVAPGNLTNQVEELLLWAERNDRVADLIAGARAANPTNKKLQAAEAAILDSSGDTAVPRAIILFDQSHGQDKWFTLPPTVGRGYKTAAGSLGQNYIVSSHPAGEKLGREALEGVSVLVLGIGPQGLCRLEDEELNAISAFVDEGGGLLALGDYTGDWHHEANLNQLIGNYGMAFERNLVVPETVGRPRTAELKLSSDHVINALPLTENGDAESAALRIRLLQDVQQAAALTACSLYVDPDAAVALLQAGPEAGTREPIPIGVTIYIADWRPVALQSIPLVAACKSAKVVVAGSRKMFLNEFVTAEGIDNGQLFQNIIRWLAA